MEDRYIFNELISQIMKIMFVQTTTLSKRSYIVIPASPPVSSPACPPGSAHATPPVLPPVGPPALLAPVNSTTNWDHRSLLYFFYLVSGLCHGIFHALVI